MFGYPTETSYTKVKPFDADRGVDTEALETFLERLARDGAGLWRVWGGGVGGFAEPAQHLSAVFAMPEFLGSWGWRRPIRS